MILQVRPDEDFKLLPSLYISFPLWFLAREICTSWSLLSAKWGCCIHFTQVLLINSGYSNRWGYLINKKLYWFFSPCSAKALCANYSVVVSVSKAPMWFLQLLTQINRSGPLCWKQSRLRATVPKYWWLLCLSVLWRICHQWGPKNLHT